MLHWGVGDSEYSDPQQLNDYKEKSGYFPKMQFCVSPQAAKDAEETPKVPLTEEEKAEKMKKMEELRVKKRAERVAQEKADEQER